MKHFNITELLDDLEERIDEGIEERLLAEWTKFTDEGWHEDIFSPARPEPIPARVDWPSISMNDAIEYKELMLLQQLKLCSDILGKPSGKLLCMRCNYGTGIVPSVFGAEIFWMDRELNTLPTSKPLAGGRDAMRKLADAGVPDIDESFSGKCFEMADYFINILRNHPKIRKWVKIFHPDYQGPMDICELLWGSSLFMDICDDPGLVKDVLSVITRTYSAMMKKWQKIVPPDAGNNVHWQALHKGTIMLREDSAMNFSPEMYEEFILPYEQELLDEFEGGGVHYCGRGDHFIEHLSTMRGVFGVAMSQPEYNNMETIYRNTVDKGIRLIGLPRSAADEAVSSGRDLHGLVHCW